LGNAARHYLSQEMGEEHSMVSSDLLFGPKIKIERAKKHVLDLNAEIKASYAREPYCLLCEEDAEAGQRVVRIKIIEEVPPIWGVLWAKTVPTLRSSLDLVMNAMVLANGSVPHRGTQFPFGSEVEELKPSFFVKVKGASTAAIDLVKELKPYEGGNR